jgi:hypothetical protein
MSLLQLQVFVYLANQVKSLHEKDFLPHYNLRTWIIIIQRISLSLTFQDDFSLKMDCWLNNFGYESTKSNKTGKSKYKCLKISPILVVSAFTDKFLEDVLENSIESPDEKTLLKLHSPKENGGKISIEKTGTSQLKKVHSILYDLFSSFNNLDGEISHLCNNPECCSPFHLVREIHQINIDRNSCKNGCFQLCPHQPKCFFVQKNGKYKDCCNKNTLPAICNCKNIETCF